MSLAHPPKTSEATQRVYFYVPAAGENIVSHVNRTMIGALGQFRSHPSPQLTRGLSASDAHFRALPVGRGDAFYLRTAAGSVLVDGGFGRYALPNLFRKYVRRTFVDVLIVTHNDADHANGIAGFLKSSLEAAEIWLPGRFLQVLPYLLSPWETVVDELVARVSVMHADQLMVPVAHEPSSRPSSDPSYRSQLLGIEHRRQESPQSIVQRYAEAIAPTIQEQEFGETAAQHSPSRVGRAREPSELVVDDGGWPLEVLASLEACAEFEVGLGWEFVSHRRDWQLIDALFQDPYRREFARGIVVAAHRIREIALAAYERGIIVRWFEHAPHAPGGGLPWLQPLSAREVARVRRAPPEKLLEYLALTVFNRQSLVFWAPPLGEHGGVLFTSDSDLDGIRLPEVLQGAIVTAPHHGSQHNAQAYARVNQAVWWVRSDARVRSRPCSQYLVAPGQRICTVCRGSLTPKQSVILWAVGGYWQADPRVRTCLCSP